MRCSARLSQVAIRALDNVIDINFYPDWLLLKPPTHVTARSASGVMGLQNALFKKTFSSPPGPRSSSTTSLWKRFPTTPYSASSELAGERGTYTSYKGSKWDRGILPQDTVDALEDERGVKVDVPRGGKMDWRPGP
jgi:ribonucleoside-diphosphate reductase alpha chain